MYTLTAEQARQLARFQEVENYCNKNSSRYAMLKPFGKWVSRLADNNKKINALVPARSADGEGATKDKGQLKAEMAASVGNICSLVVPYALDTADNTLYNAVNFTATDVSRLRDSAVFGFITTLTGVIAPLLSRPDFADYPVTAEDLEGLTKAAGTFNDSLGNNKMIDKESSIASANIDALLSDNRLILGKLGKLANYLRKTDPDFATGYRAAAALNNSGIHHSGVRGSILNPTTGQPVENASLILTGKKSTKSAISNSDGAFEMIRFMPGRCKLTLTAPGYESQTIEVAILRGRITELNISLQSLVINLATA